MPLFGQSCLADDKGTDERCLSARQQALRLFPVEFWAKRTRAGVSNLGEQGGGGEDGPGLITKKIGMAVTVRKRG